jgi:hypothetical protein
MGCITSRGYDWPPKPYKRIVVRDMLVDQIENGEVKKVRVSVEDYVWVRPGCEIPNGGGGSGASYDDDASPGQETAIRNMEDS